MFDYTLILAVDLSLHPLHKAEITVHALPHSGISSLYTLHWSKRFEKKCAWNKNMMTSTALVRNIRWKTKRKSQKSRQKHLKNPISLFKVFLYRTAIYAQTTLCKRSCSDCKDFRKRCVFVYKFDGHDIRSWFTITSLLCLM